MGRFLVTGGAGFIGSHVVTALVEAGHEVRVLDNLSSGALENLEAVGSQIELLIGDILDPETCSIAMAHVTHVIHLAARTSVRESMLDPISTSRTNAEGTLNILKAARLQDVRGFAFASSASVYGNTLEMPISEKSPLAPLSPYAASKLEGEQHCLAFREEFGLATSILRFFNVYGPRQSAQSQYASVIPRFIERCVEGKSPTVFGDGEQSRDFIYVGDVARSLVHCALEAEKTPGPYNVCTGNATSLNTLLDELGKTLGVRPLPFHVAAVPGDIRHSKGDPSALRNALALTSAFQSTLTPLDQGLRNTVEWFQLASRANALFISNSIC